MFFGMLAAILVQDALVLDPVELPLTHQVTWSSQSLDGDRQIYLAGPIRQVPDGEALPLVIVMDGDIMFGLTSDTARLMSFENSAPPLVVAGIGYGSLNGWMAGRNADYSPQDGGAGLAEFTRAVVAEALPLIRETVPFELGEVFVYGHSSGGRVALEAARYEEVDGVIDSSPSMEEEVEWASALAGAYAAQRPPAEIFIAVGSEESATREAIDTFLSDSGLDSEVTPIVVPNATHMQVIPTIYAEGLRRVVAED